ncbi:MAG: hypothetical protein GX624_00610 [Actinobacteria bacterium]|nr:hypothetical protein [Actinomycetota bacterium]
MSWLRAAARRLDPWAALVLGGLLAMAVVILLATPGPWQRVVGEEDPPVRLEAPAPDDVALFVMGGRGGACSGIVWLHLDTERHALTAVVVAPLVSGFSPDDGYAPVADIADSAGPGAAATALGGALGVSMDAWVALDRRASDLAIQAMFPMSDLRPARPDFPEARSAWRGRGGEERAWITQFESLRVALPLMPFEKLGVVAFSNYVLGFGFVRSDLTLQGATSLAEALKETDRAMVEVRAAPVVVERCRDGRVWHADASRVQPLIQSLALGMAPPETRRLVSRRERAARVLVVAPLGRSQAARYAAEVRRQLAASAGAPVEVTLVSGTDERLAFRTARELDRRPALAVLVAPARPGDLDGIVVEKVCALLRQRRQQAVVSSSLTSRGKDAALSAALEQAVARGRLPVSRLPRREGTVSGRRAELAAAARANVQTLVRACWPGTLAPDLASTRLGFSFVAARHTAAGIVSASEETGEALSRRLRVWGFVAAPLPEADAGSVPDVPAVAYRPGSRTAAEALSADLGMPEGSVVRVDDVPRKLVLVVGR